MELVWIFLIGVGFFIGTNVGKNAGKEEAYAGQDNQIQGSLADYGKFHADYGIRGAYGLNGHELREGTRFFIVHAEDFKAHFGQK